MIANEYQKQHERLKKLVAMTIDDRRAETEKEELQDMEEEAEIELSIDLPLAKAKRGHRLKLPTPETVVTWNPDGTPLSYFRDPRWKFFVGHDEVSVGFEGVHEELGLDLSSGLCAPLVMFLKLLSFFSLPGNNPFSYINKHTTFKSHHHKLLHLCSFLHEKGYLYGKEGGFLGLSTLSPDSLRSELLDRISKDETAFRVCAFASAIGQWIKVSSIVDLPKEYAATFSPKQMWAGNLSRTIVSYRASNLTPYDVIEFDDLVQMFKMSQKYMENYVDDALFIGGIFDWLYTEMPRDPQGRVVPLRITYGRTKEKAQEIVTRTYAIDPETGAAWFKPMVTDSETYVDKDYLRKAVWEMEAVCVFLLYIWTAMRRKELHTLTVDALSVDGKPLDPNQSAIVQVRQGKTFALTRVVTKTNEELTGEEMPVPLPMTAAQAFAVLVDLYSKGRQSTGNQYLLPNGDFGYPQGKGYKKGKTGPACNTEAYEVFRSFCDIAGVKPYHPHRCRKTMATVLINHDPACIELIRDLLCHVDIDMTRRYLMSLPGIAEEARRLFVTSQSEAVVEIITSAVEGKFAGPAGDRASEAILANIDAFKGNRLSQTIKTLEETLIRSNFIVVRTPAAWCLRFEARVPWDAPCLPPPSKRRTGEIAAPNFEKCQDWLCKFSGYTPSDLHNAKDRKTWAEKMSSNASSGASRAHFQEMAHYWERIIDQLENGKPEIVGLRLVDTVFAEAGAYA